MRIGVVGSRTYNNYPKMETALDAFCKDRGLSFRDVTIVSGGAKGADTLGKQYAKQRQCGYKEYLPNYNSYGRSAPFVRNELIVKDSDIIIAFWDGISRGTADTISQASQHGVEVIIHSL